MNRGEHRPACVHDGERALEERLRHLEWPAAPEQVKQRCLERVLTNLDRLPGPDISATPASHA